MDWIILGASFMCWPRRICCDASKRKGSPWRRPLEAARRAWSAILFAALRSRPLVSAGIRVGTGLFALDGAELEERFLVHGALDVLFDADQVVHGNGQDGEVLQPVADRMARRFVVAAEGLNVPEEVQVA